MEYLEFSARITRTLLSWSDTLIMLVDEILALRSVYAGSCTLCTYPS